MPNRNAHIGRNVETLFKNSIGDNLAIVQKIQTHFNITGRFLNAISTGIHSEKADVKIEFADGRNVDANVKAYKESVAYNQLTRTSIHNFCEKFNLPCESLLTQLFVSKAGRVSSELVPDDKKEEVQGYLEPIAQDIINWAFSFKRGREILVLYERQENIFRIYSMSQVLGQIGAKFSYTGRDNIMLGKYVVFQRKGGNGVHAIRIAKTNPSHPGNNVQLKLRMNDFVRDMKALEIASYAP